MATTTHLKLAGVETDEMGMEAVATIAELRLLIEEQKRINEQSNRNFLRALRIATTSTANIQDLQVSVRNRLAIEGKRKAAPGDYPEAA